MLDFLLSSSKLLLGSWRILFCHSDRIWNNFESTGVHRFSDSVATGSVSSDENSFSSTGAIGHQWEPRLRDGFPGEDILWER